MNEDLESYGGDLGQETVTADVNTTGVYVINTRGRAVLTVDLNNTGSVALNSLKVDRQVWTGGRWHTLNAIGSDYELVTPQQKAFSIDPDVNGYVHLDPTTLAAGDWVRLVIPCDGHKAIRLLPTAASNTTIVGMYSLGD